ncbi:MAG TPA: hypothetical protein VIH59_00195 [Candidatus Tectomicrobia bacterium]
MRQRLFAQRAAPASGKSDGPECMPHRVTDWLHALQVDPALIATGITWQDGYHANFKGVFRDGASTAGSLPRSGRPGG